MKKRFRKIVAGVSAAALAVTTMLSNVWAEGNDKYPHAYTIRNILADYQYFTSGNLTGDSHTVGAIAVGGELNSTFSFGYAQYIPSYINTYINSGNFAKNAWTNELKLSEPTIANSSKVFYGNGDIQKDDYIKNPEYIDFDHAFKVIEYQSRELLNTAIELDTSDVEIYTGHSVKALVIDFNQNKNYKISYDTFYNANFINIVIDDIQDFTTDQYTISVYGVNDKPISLKTIYGLSDGGQPQISITFNNEFNNFDTQYFKSLYNSLMNGQINLNELRLIWNFPDATNISTSHIAGHVVAPIADYTQTGGGHEGSVIAKNISAGGSEAHYYPYYDPRVPEQYDPNEPTIPDDGESTTTDDETGSESSTGTDVTTTTDDETGSESSTSTDVTTTTDDETGSESSTGTDVTTTTDDETGSESSTGTDVTTTTDDETGSESSSSTDSSKSEPTQPTPPSSPQASSRPSYPSPTYPDEETEVTSAETTAPATTPAETTAAETTPAETTAPATTAPETKAPEISTAQTPKVTFVDIDPETEETTSETSKTIASEAENGGDSGLAENEYETDANGNPIRPDETDTNGGNGVDGSSENPETGIENLIVLPIMLGAAATAFALSKKRKNSSK